MGFVPNLQVDTRSVSASHVQRKVSLDIIFNQSLHSLHASRPNQVFIGGKRVTCESREETYFNNSKD